LYYKQNFRKKNIFYVVLNYDVLVVYISLNLYYHQACIYEHLNKYFCILRESKNFSFWKYYYFASL